MGSVLEKPEDVFHQFEKDIRGLFGKETVSVIVYGSAATGEYVPKKSDINFLVVLTQEGLTHIQRVQKMVARWQRLRISLPLFLTREYIQASLDSFPIEFLNMKTAYHVVWGDDVLADIAFRQEDLRLQCEREMKGKLLQLRQGFVMTRGRVGALRRLIVDSIVAFVSIFRALLYLKGAEVPGTKQEVLLTMCREFKLDESLFSVLLSVKKYEARLTKFQLESNVQRYIAEVEKLSQAVDYMVVMKKK